MAPIRSRIDHGNIMIRPMAFSNSFFLGFKVSPVSDDVVGTTA